MHTARTTPLMHTRRIILASFLLGMTGTPPTCTAGALEDQPGGAPTPLRVATLNVAHGRGLALSQFTLTAEEFRANVAALTAVIRQKRPDVLALQEADGRSAWSGLFDHVDYIAEHADYRFVHHGIHFEAGIGDLSIRYGTALLSRFPLRSTASHRSVVRQFHTKGFVTAEFDFHGRPVVVVSLHLDSSSADVRRKEAGNIVDVLSQLKKPLIVMGDFNSRWTSETDAVRTITKRLQLRAFQPESGEGEARPTTNPPPPPSLMTFRSTGPVSRIDWILISHDLEFVEYGVWVDKISDHRGVEATIKWRKP